MGNLLDEKDCHFQFAIIAVFLRPITMGGVVRLNHYSKRILQWRHKIPAQKSFESIDEQPQERTTAAANDPATHVIKFAVPPQASHPPTCVPKLRLPTPSDTPVQRAEFANNM